MTTLQYLTQTCCSTKELMELARADKEAVEMLKVWARAEMLAKGIEVK
jgi:hypothetical protein